jgi:hypothetical protein
VTWLLPPFGIPEWRMPKHAALAIENQRSRVPFRGERARLLVVVANREFDGLNAEFVAEVGLQAGVASDREVGGAAVLHDDEAGFASTVVQVGIDDELTRD